ncbi:hypothetical protein F4808DRAFT_287092 [Astrocystis sublimbata]|nr:hypothetical protein F4808DRAFT_287092 [Astrocystis sublimbata]
MKHHLSPTQLLRLAGHGTHLSTTYYYCIYHTTLRYVNQHYIRVPFPTSCWLPLLIREPEWQLHWNSDAIDGIACPIRLMTDSTMKNPPRQNDFAGTMTSGQGKSCESVPYTHNINNTQHHNATRLQDEVCSEDPERKHGQCRHCRKNRRGEGTGHYTQPKDECKQASYDAQRPVPSAQVQSSPVQAQGSPSSCHPPTPPPPPPSIEYYLPPNTTQRNATLSRPNPCRHACHRRCWWLVIQVAAAAETKESRNQRQNKNNNRL